MCGHQNQAFVNATLYRRRAAWCVILMWFLVFPGAGKSNIPSAIEGVDWPDFLLKLLRGCQRLLRFLRRGRCLTAGQRSGWGLLSLQG